VYSIKDHQTERQPFFSFLGDSVLAAGKLVLIIIAFVISFVALADLIDRLIHCCATSHASLNGKPNSKANGYMKTPKI
jgi:purine nucleoside transport protein